jgi:ribonuclease J
VSVRAVARSADNRNFEDMLRRAVEQAAEKGFANRALPLGDGRSEYDWVGVRTALERTVRQIAREVLQSAPLVQVLLQTTGTAGADGSIPTRRPATSDPGLIRTGA